LRLAELVEHYRQKELATDNEWKTFVNEGHIRGLPEKVDCATVGSDPSRRD
jgi:hypothetical protein